MLSSEDAFKLIILTCIQFGADLNGVKKLFEKFKEHNEFLRSRKLPRIAVTRRQYIAAKSGHIDKVQAENMKKKLIRKKLEL